MALFQARHVEKQLSESLCKEDGSGFTRREERSSCLNMGVEKLGECGEPWEITLLQ